MQTGHRDAKHNVRPLQGRRQGTQLTLRTFHNSGVAGGDITQGLPRVEELFEARTPKGQAYVTEIAGLVDVWEDGKKYIVQVTPESGKVERLPLDGRTIVVKAGSSVKAGDVPEG